MRTGIDLSESEIYLNVFEQFIKENVDINDLPNCLRKTNANIFAEDTSLSCDGSSSDEIEHKLNHDLEMMDIWLNANKLTLNRKKKRIIDYWLTAKAKFGL